MKLKSTFFILLFMVFSTAMKANNLPIAIAANESITVTLFFPTEIKKVIQPANNYKFEYEQNATMATLVARKGAVSNLTVITKCGSIFSFLLKYNTEVENFTYVLSAEQAIGKMKDSGAVAVNITEQQGQVVENELTKATSPKTETEAKLTTTKYTAEPKTFETVSASFTDGAENENESSVRNDGSLYEADKEDYYSIFCENNYLQKANFKKSKAAVNRIGLQLNNILKDRNELYFVMEITNDSWSDFKVKSLRFYVKSLEVNSEIQIEELFGYNMPETVSEHSVHNLVFVAKNFKLAERQKVYVLLEELDGKQRSVMLPLGAEQLNQ